MRDETRPRRRKPEEPPQEVSGFGESEDEEDANEEKSAVEEAEEVAEGDKIPSAASLLAGGEVSAKWLQKPQWTQREVGEEPSKKVANRRKETTVKKEEPKEEVDGHDMYEFYDPATGWQNKQSSNINDDHSGYGRSSRFMNTARPSTINASGPKKRGAAPVSSKSKDRIKQQRLTGQSGIGDDFRVWRSEEEMRLRQLFD